MRMIYVTASLLPVGTLLSALPQPKVSSDPNGSVPCVMADTKTTMSREELMVQQRGDSSLIPLYELLSLLVIS